MWQSAAEKVRSRTAEIVRSKASAPSGGGGAMFAGGQGGMSSMGGGGGNDATAELLNHNRGWVYACVRLFAQRIAGLKFRVAQKANGQGARRLSAMQIKSMPDSLKSSADTAGLEPIEDHPLVQLIENPNEFMTGWALFYVTISALELTGKAYWWIRKAKGMVQLWPLPPNWVTPIHSAADLFAQWKVQPDGSMGEGFTLNGDEVVYFNYPDVKNPIGSYSTLEAQDRTVRADESISEAQYRIFQNGVFPRHAIILGKSVAPDTGADSSRPRLADAQYQQILELVKKRYRGVTRFDEPIILDAIIEDVKRLNNTPLEMDFQNSGLFTKARILQAYACNEISLGAVENANRASAAIADRHLCNEINAKLMLLSQAITQWVGPLFDGGDRLVCWIEKATPNDPEMDLSEWGILAANGACSRNELRAAIKGLPPIVGGDSIGVPFSMMDIPIQIEGHQSDNALLIQPPADPAAAGVPEDEADGEAGDAGATDSGKSRRRGGIKASKLYDRRFSRAWLRQHGVAEIALKDAVSDFFRRADCVDFEDAFPNGEVLALPSPQGRRND